MYFNFSFCGSRVLNGHEQINIFTSCPRLYVGGFLCVQLCPGSGCRCCWFCCPSLRGCWFCPGFCPSAALLLLGAVVRLLGLSLLGFILALWRFLFRGAVGVLGRCFRAVVGGSASCGETPEGDIHRPEPGEGVA